MNKFLILFIIFLGTSLWGNAQTNKVHITGTIIGDDTNEPLPFTNIIVDSTGTTSNLYGKFSIKVNPGDSILFSYISYKRRLFVVPDSIQDTKMEIVIILLKDITFLKGVTITSLPATLDDFKEAILSTKLKDSKELENAQRGMSLATYQYLYMRSFKLPMSDYDNYAMFLKGNEGLNPAGGNIKGLLKFLANRAKGIPLEGTYQHYKYYEKNKGQ